MRLSQSSSVILVTLIFRTSSSSPTESGSRDAKFISTFMDLVDSFVPNFRRKAPEAQSFVDLKRLAPVKFADPISERRKYAEQEDKNFEYQDYTNLRERGVDLSSESTVMGSMKVDYPTLVHNLQNRHFEDYVEYPQTEEDEATVPGDILNQFQFFKPMSIGNYKQKQGRMEDSSYMEYPITEEPYSKKLYQKNLREKIKKLYKQPTKTGDNFVPKPTVSQNLRRNNIERKRNHPKPEVNLVNIEKGTEKPKSKDKLLSTNGFKSAQRKAEKKRNDAMQRRMLKTVPRDQDNSVGVYDDENEDDIDQQIIKTDLKKTHHKRPMRPYRPTRTPTGMPKIFNNYDTDEDVIDQKAVETNKKETTRNGPRNSVKMSEILKQQSKSEQLKHQIFNPYDTDADVDGPRHSVKMSEILKQQSKSEQRKHQIFNNYDTDADIDEPRSSVKMPEILKQQSKSEQHKHQVFNNYDTDVDVIDQKAVETNKKETTRNGPRNPDKMSETLKQQSKSEPSKSFEQMNFWRRRFESERLKGFLNSHRAGGGNPDKIYKKESTEMSKSIYKSFSSRRPTKVKDTAVDEMEGTKKGLSVEEVINKQLHEFQKNWKDDGWTPLKKPKKPFIKNPNIYSISKDKRKNYNKNTSKRPSSFGYKRVRPTMSSENILVIPTEDIYLTEDELTTTVSNEDVENSLKRPGSMTEGDKSDVYPLPTPYSPTPKNIIHRSKIKWINSSLKKEDVTTDNPTIILEPQAREDDTNRKIDVDIGGKNNVTNITESDKNISQTDDSIDSVISNKNGNTSDATTESSVVDEEDEIMKKVKVVFNPPDYESEDGPPSRQIPIFLEIPGSECPKYCIRVQVEITRTGRQVSRPRCRSSHLCNGKKGKVVQRISLGGED